jgi:hypothetical protein
MSTKCPNCGFHVGSDHWNPATLLPPVGSPIHILVDMEDRLVKRDQYAKSKSDGLVFDDLLEMGKSYEGKFRWRHA